MYPFGKGVSRLIPYLLLLIPLALYIVYYVGPSLFTVMYSFTDMTNVVGKGFHFVGWDNYKELFYSGNSKERIASMYRTVYFMLAVTIIQNGVALFVAIVLNQKLKGDRFYRSVFFLPVVLGVAVVALIWSLMFEPISGPVQAIYRLFDYKDTFLGSFTHAFNYLIFMQIWEYMGYSMLIFLAGLQTVPQDLYDAGFIDGTSRWQSFKSITFPLIAPAFTVNILLSIIGSMQTFDIFLATTDGRFNTRTMAYDVYMETFRGNLEMGLPSALSVIQFLFIFVFVIFAVFLLRKREVEM